MPPTPDPRAIGARSAAAGFWQRGAAWTLDAAVLALPAWWLSRPALAAAGHAGDRAMQALGRLLAQVLRRMVEGETALATVTALRRDPLLTEAAAGLQSALLQGLGVPAAWFALLAFAWHVGFERSGWNASPGKRLLGLYVTDGAGARPPAWRSAWRFLTGTASWLSLNLGHAMALLPARHALHDLLSDTRVRARAPGLPAWARAWLWALALASLAGGIWALRWLQQAMQAALERALGA